MNPHAQALGRRAKGAPKTLTKEQRQFRAKQLAKVRAKRWPKRKSEQAR